MERVSSSKLRAGDVVIVAAGEGIPGDGEVIEGIATVDESVITGESAPVIRESGGDRSAVTGGTRVLSDRDQDQDHLESGRDLPRPHDRPRRRRRAAKDAERDRLNIMIAGLTIIFLFAVATLVPYAIYSVNVGGRGHGADDRGVCRAAGMPDSHNDRRAAVRDRDRGHGPRDAAQRPGDERQGRRSCGDVNTLLLDKTGTITLGNRQAVAFVPALGVTDAEIADAAQLSSLPDETPEGRSIVVLAKEKYGLRGREIPEDAQFIPFSAYTKMSGVDIDGRQLRKGATDAIVAFVKQQGGTFRRK